LRLAIVIDTSNSQRASAVYEAAVRALPEFAAQMLDSADDRALIEQFDVVPSATRFVTKTELRSVKVNLTPGGGTALYDAVRFACDERMKKDPTEPSRRVIVLISDGDDNQSHIGRAEAITSTQEAGAVIFAISTAPEAYGNAHGDNVLKQFSEQTGGLAFLQLNRKDLSKVFATIKEQIDNMGVLSYVPASPLQNGQRRTLELKSASNRKLKFRAPKAYYLNAATQ